MYFTIKYNVLYKYMISMPTTAINTCIKVIWHWSKGGSFFLFSLVTNKGEHSIFSQSNQTLTRQKGVRKDSNTVKGAILLNLRHPRERFKSYPTRIRVVRYDLNLILGCHRFYDLSPLPLLDPIFLTHWIK